MEAFEIDLDSECVWLDDAWLNRDDLARKIKSMIDAGDFQIARPSSALEALTKAIANARVLGLRVSPELSDALNAVSAQTGRPVGSIAREAIQNWLAQQGQPAQQPATPLPLNVPMPLVARSGETPPMPLTAAVSSASDQVTAEHVTTEPATEADAANAVALTPKAAAKDGEDVEKRWFDK